MITLKNVRKMYAENVILEDVNLTLNITDKIGIVGKNGSGKTTLLKIIKDSDYATFGEVIYSNHKVAFLDQEKQLEKFDKIIDVINDTKREIVNLNNEMQSVINDVNFANDQSLIEYYGELDTKFQALGGYEIDSKIGKIFSQFNFKPINYEDNISELSGGQKTRLALAKLLVENPDFLILDEPTNHLDIETIQWLENYLKLQAKGVVIVSHDRFFLKRVCNKIFDVENQSVKVYNSSYDDYLNEKHLDLQRRIREYENIQTEKKKLEEFIVKFRGKPSKVNQVNDRKSKLKRLEDIEKPIINDEHVNFEISSFHLKKSAYVELMDADIGYDVPIIRDVNFRLNGGDKVGILGENASGKSTLIKTILKQVNLINGRLIVHPKIKIGYFDQNFIEFTSNNTIYDEIYEFMKDESQTQIRKYLAKFLFKKDDIYKKISDLSGGEKVRFLFAKLALEKYDLLIMDEPTNHLDTETKEQLEDVLTQYKGTLLLISHDRYFINRIVSSVGVIHNNQFSLFEGNYDDYLKFKESVVVKKVVEKKKKTKKQVKTVRNEDKIIKQIENAELKEKELLEMSSLEENYSDYLKMQQINKQIVEIQNQIQDLYNSLDS